MLAHHFHTITARDNYYNHYAELVSVISPSNMDVKSHKLIGGH